MSETKKLGELVIQVSAMPRDTNPRGDIFGGWLMGLMDIASANIAPKGKSATRAADNIEFIKAVQVGDLVSCYGYVLKIGKTSATVHVDVYVGDDIVAKGDFVNVALGDDGKPRVINQHKKHTPSSPKCLGGLQFERRRNK